MAFKDASFNFKKNAKIFIFSSSNRRNWKYSYLEIKNYNIIFYCFLFFIYYLMAKYNVNLCLSECISHIILLYNF